MCPIIVPPVVPHSDWSMVPVGIGTAVGRRTNIRKRWQYQSVVAGPYVGSEPQPPSLIRRLAPIPLYYERSGSQFPASLATVSAAAMCYNRVHTAEYTVDRGNSHVGLTQRVSVPVAARRRRLEEQALQSPCRATHSDSRRE